MLLPKRKEEKEERMAEELEVENNKYLLSIYHNLLHMII